MAHLSIFKQFDKLKKVGDSFLLPITTYKNFQSARGTVTSGATDYRKMKDTDFYVSTHQINNWTMKVERVKNEASHTKEKKEETITKSVDGGTTFHLPRVSEQMLRNEGELHNHEKYVAALFNKMGQLCNP